MINNINNELQEIHDLHRFLSIIQNLNVGVIVVDRSFTVKIWNNFMEVNSGISGNRINGQNLYKFFPEIENSWLKDKIMEAFTLETPVFSSWEQHSEVFKFVNNRPFTGRSMNMYMNFSIIPMNSLSCGVDEVTIIIYDVTDESCSKLGLQEANNKLHQMSITDGLTGIFNRAYWEEALRHQYNYYLRTKHPVTLLMFDIDHFKKVNDTYGHPAGDAVLKDVAKILKKSIRSTDIAGRYGGEEFGVILLDATREFAYFIAERLRKNVEEHTVFYNNLTIKFTISIGLCTLSDVTPSAKEWLVRTDNSLYFAKEHGRNRCTQYGLNDTEETKDMVIPIPVKKTKQ
ncbi:MAG: diguanylate cyclase [Succinivibrionaceae bacterium]